MKTKFLILMCATAMPALADNTNVTNDAKHPIPAYIAPAPSPIVTTPLPVTATTPLPITATTPIPVKVDQTTPGTTNSVAVTRLTGAAFTANGQVTTSGTAGTLVAARGSRRSVSITNYDTAITVYIGIATVTTANGYRLLPGQSVTVDSVVLIQVIAASGTPVVGYMETYD